MNLIRGGKHSTAWRSAKRATTAFLILLAVCLVGVGFGVRSGQLGLQPVLSGSMVPAVHAGDVAVLWRVPTSTVRVGDVISFYPPGDTSVPKMHRIVSLTRTPQGVQITTKGDANGVADPWGRITLQGTTAYRMVGVVTLLGWPAVAIGHFLAGLLLIAAGSLLAFVTYRSLRHPSQPHAAPAAKGSTP